MEEEQIIKEIVDTLYGNDSLYKYEDKDKDEIKQIRKQKDEKYDEIFRQINSVCERIEDDLRTTLGSEDLEFGKIVRANVVETIQIEVANGNSILNSNGKINGEKIYSDVLKKKAKIVNQINLKNNENQAEVVENGIGKHIKNEEQQKEEIKKRINYLGLGLTEVQNKKLEDMMFDAENIIKMYEDLIEKEQLTPEEAIAIIIKGKTPEEIIEITNALNVYVAVDVVESEQKARNSEKETENQESTINNETSKSRSTDMLTEKDVKMNNGSQQERSSETSSKEDNISDEVRSGTEYIVAAASAQKGNKLRPLPDSIKRKMAEVGGMTAMALDLLGSIERLEGKANKIVKLVDGIEIAENVIFPNEIPMEYISMGDALRENDSIINKSTNKRQIEESTIESYFNLHQEELIVPFEIVEPQKASVLLGKQGIQEHFSFLRATDVYSNDITEEAGIIKKVLEEDRRKEEDKKEFDNSQQEGEEFDK